jgi:Ni/Fe-hydrogenase subunit HybB-like protein
MSQIRKSYGTSLILLLAALAAAGLGLGIVRLISGLGTTTALNDGYPWGLWIIYDVFFVPFSAGAFMILTVTHIYNRKEYHAIARPVVLAGFLGEVMVIAVLVMDLGRWQQFYNVLFPWYWNIHSFMFQVSICLTIYMGVMVLEVAPAILERLGWQKPLRLIRMATVGIAGLGILLSSLHQSALGSLFLLIPYKLHALWWSPLLPLLFFVSAAFAGLCMAIFVSAISFQAFHRRLELEPLANLARIAAALLGIYLLLKVGDLIVDGEIGLLFSSGWLGVLLIVELVLGVVVPLVLFALPRFRHSRSGLIWGSAAALAGVALNRTNVALLAYQAPAGASYAPHWIEVTISVAAVAGGVLLFTLAVRFLPILPGSPEQRARLGWSPRTILFVSGVLSLITIAVIALSLPVTEAQAGRNGSVVPTEVPATATCSNCHSQPQMLTAEGVEPDRVAQLTVEPQPLTQVHGRIRCVTCHYGQEGTEEIEAAHQGIVVDPTVNNAQVCLACHPDLPAEFAEDRLRTPHDEISHGQAADVACSDCHGSVGHGFDPVSGEIICPMSICLDCHQDRQLGSDLTDCDACHVGPHDPAPNLDCSACHATTTDWQEITAGDHALALDGKHQEILCLDCHVGNPPLAASADLTCAGCHQPPAGDHYAGSCETCHTTGGFDQASLPVQEHPTPLVGAHQNAPCQGCHVADQGAPQLDDCTDCHEPPQDHLSGRCDMCHTPEGWADSIAYLVGLAGPISHDVEGQADCLLCHDPEGKVQPAPSNHDPYQNEQCTLCHKPQP